MKEKVRKILGELDTCFREHADPKKAKEMSAYMKNQFPFLGLQKPLRAKLQKAFLLDLKIAEPEDFKDIIRWCWKKDEREYQYFCIEFLLKYEKKAKPDISHEYEWMLKHKAWWDTVDVIAARLVGENFRKFPDEKARLLEDWIQSDDFWLNRSAILFQLFYKEETDEKLLFSLCRKFAPEEEFFLRKAIGWALRQYARTKPEAVRHFVDNTPLSGLSRREAMKHLE